jgi:hypothetical protein
VANAVMNLRVPYNAGKFLNAYTIGGLLCSAQLHGVGYLSVNMRFTYKTAFGRPDAVSAFYSLSPETGTSSVSWAELSMFHLNLETESSLRNVVF